MGLPEIIIEFKTKGVTAIKRSARGIVAIVLKDDTEAVSYTHLDVYKRQRRGREQIIQRGQHGLKRSARPLKWFLK